MKNFLLFLSAAAGFLLLGNKAYASIPNIAYASTTYTYTVGTAVSISPSTLTGNPAPTVTITPALPTGLSISATTGVISGTPTGTSSVTYTVKATNTNGNRTATITITIIAAPTLSYTSPAAYTVNTAITPLSPTSSGVATTGFGTGVQLTGATLNTPEGMAIDGSGNIYVTNYGNNTVSKYNSAGVYQGTFGTGATYAEPSGIVFDASGNAYVLNRSTTGNGKVYKYNSAGVYQSTIITGLSRAYGIAIDASGNLYIADENANRVYKYTNTGTLSLTINTNLNAPWGVAVDASGNIYAINNGNGRVTKYTSAGTYVSNFLTGFNTPYAISIDASGNVYVGDSGTGAVYEYNSTGTLLATENAATVNDPEGMVVDSKGDLYVSDETNNTVYKYPPAGGYFLSGTLPPGLSFNTNTGTLSGTPTTTFSATTYTVTAYNAAGASVTATFTISCIVSPPSLSYSGTPYSYTTGISNTTATISNSGGAVTSTYTLSITTGALPAGITFSTATGTFTVVPTAAGAFTGTVTASNSGGSSSAPISMTVTNPAPPSITYSSPAPTYVFIQNTALTVGTEPTPTNTGGALPASNAYSYTGTLPTGLAFNTTTGIITGTPTVITAATSITVTATNAGGTSSATFTITVNPPAPIITYTTPNTWLVGTLYTLNPTNTGGAVSTWSNTGTFPPGVTLNTANGVISGTPTTPGSYSVTVTATNVTGSSSKTVTFTINYPAPVISYSPSNPYLSGASINLAVTNSESAVTTGYTYTGTLPTGVTLNASTGAISGTAPTVTTTTSYSATITASTGSSTGNTTVTIIINPLAPVISYANPGPYTVGTAISPLIPSNSGGAIGTSTAYAATTILTSSNGLSNPYGMATDASGNVYVVNKTANTITEYSTTGTVTTVSTGAGTGPVGIVFDSSGNAYVLNQTAKTIVKYTGGISGTASTLVNGTGLSTPTGLSIDGSNVLYVSNNGNNTITEYSSSTGANTKTINAPTFLGITYAFMSAGITVDASGNIYVADNSYFGFLPGVDEYNAAGTLVGETQIGTAISALYIDSSGNIYVTDTGAKTVTEYTAGFATTVATETGLGSPRGTTSDQFGNFYVSDYTNNTVIKYRPIGNYKISPALPAGLSFNASTGVITGVPHVPFSSTTFTITGNNATAGSTTTITLSCTANPPVISYSPSTVVYPIGVNITPLVPTVSGGPMIPTAYTTPGTSFTGTATLNKPFGMTTDASGNIWVANYGNKTVVEYGPTGTVLNTFTVNTNPTGVAVDASGNFYVSYNGGNIYKYNSSGTGATLLGNTGGSAIGITIDAAGNLFVSDAADGVIWKYSGGTLSSFVPVTGTDISAPVGIGVDAAGDVFFVDQGYQDLVEYSPSGTFMSAVIPGLNTPYGLHIDANGDYFIADAGARTVSEYNIDGTLIASIGGLTNPRGLTTDAQGNIYVADWTNNTITKYSPSTYYKISPATLPTGLTFNVLTGTFSGIPSAPSGPTTYTISVDGTDGNGSTTVTITCAYPPSFTYTTPQTYTDGIAIPTLSPIFATPNGGGPLVSATVTTNGPLPAGLTLNPDGTITGTPTVVSGPITYTITGTNAAGLSGTATVTITCNPALPHISYITPDVYNVGTTITPLVPTNTGGAVASWSISPGLPPGLSFDTTTGIISGTPTAVSANTNYTVTATNVTGSATCVVTIEVNSATPIISYITPDTYTVGNVIVPLVPTNTGSPAVTWSISAPLPSGLNFDTTTGIITGTPTVVSPATNYTVTATNGGGSSVFVINITCVNPGPVLTYTTPDIFPVGIAITPLAPVNTGTAPTSYSISPGLPSGLNFDTTTGIISGTPTVTSAATNYVITATDASSNTGTATISIACTGANDWLGGTSTDWTDATNWALGTVPTVTDVAAIGANVPFTNFPNLLAGAGTISVGSVIIGTNGGQAGGVVVNSGSTLSVAGTITYQSDANAGLGYTATLSGAGSITAAGINVTANTALGSGYTETMASSVSSLALSGNLSLNSTDASGNDFNATFNITGGITSVAGAVQTSNTANGTSTLTVANATLQLAGSTALSGLSGTGTNVMTFNNAGATIEYSGTGQTYYTNAGITGLPSGVTYSSIKFSGSGVKSPNGTNANNLTITGDFTNALTTNDASDYIDLSKPLVNFNGTSQNIYAGSGTGTEFYNITISTTGTTTIQSGAASVASTGVLTMSGASAVLAAGSNLLTLNSDINGTATVAAIPAGCSVTGTVNAQRFITGGALNYRGYRLASSPVYGSNDGTGNIYSINYLINSVYLKGTTGTAGGFDAAGNPNIFFFRENLAGNNSSFTSGNFRGVNTLGFAPNFNYLMDVDGGPYNMPVGAGYMFFFRGDRSQASLTTESNTTYIPTNTTLTATGTLNQGTITARDWYTPTSTNLGYTTISGMVSVEGYNLVGNPYASSIDWDQYQTGTPGSGIYAPNVNPFLYIIDPVSNNYNVYQAGNGGAGTIISSMSNVIPSGQGFFVTAANASAQLVFNESAKTNVQANAANGNLLMARRVAAAATATSSQYLHLKILKDSINTDGIIIRFSSTASTAFNPAGDARYKNGNGSVSLSSMSADNISLAINSMPLPEVANKQTIIPLTVSGTTDGTYQIQMAAIKNIPALFTIWLKDAYMKDSLDVRANSTYLFDILHSDTNSYGAHRFTLVMGENAALMVHLLSFGASKIQGGDQVVWTTENEQNYTNFTVERSTDAGTTFNDLGAFVSSGQGTYNYLDNAPVNGANQYRLKIVDINGAITYSNVVTIMYANTNGQIAINGLMVYPNPTGGTVHLSIPTSQGTVAKPNYSIEIVNNLGSVIKSATSSSPLWQSDVTSLTPGTYFIRVVDISNNTVVGRSAFVKL